MESLNAAVISMKGAVNLLSGTLLSKINGVFSLAAYSQTIVNFILQFIPPPILLLFLVEIGAGVMGFIFGVIGKFKLIIKWFP